MNNTRPIVSTVNTQGNHGKEATIAGSRYWSSAFRQPCCKKLPLLALVIGLQPSGNHAVAQLPLLVLVICPQPSGNHGKEATIAGSGYWSSAFRQPCCKQLTLLALVICIQPSGNHGKEATIAGSGYWSSALRQLW